jgi:MFS family permease
LLAAAVDRSVYGRAFGFERAMDTVGAILGPLTALWLLAVFPGKYHIVFALTLLPGMIAAALIGLVVQEKKRAPVPHVSFGERLSLLPKVYQRRGLKRQRRLLSHVISVDNLVGVYT